VCRAGIMGGICEGSHGGFLVVMVTAALCWIGISISLPCATMANKTKSPNHLSLSIRHTQRVPRLCSELKERQDEGMVVF